ncbi:(heptosyl)LPS beta-1,4-glucosyltransferase [Allopseudospirillum japonicum]|uniref:(Heptosyl)LPS beta-1,4-glucosyltransferase n=1 Tax=Allopseudospirillum japonicum TaxID=64971 RepID=A0A1H6R8I8_9GAMM|nr:glycosyltransferase family 2 protein [Allopseudospirillum japonicum]SEI49554.1 (heptosyl)LPS beta-1,4-glucosyltransferase [Allopseudospirillum japonicum]
MDSLMQVRLSVVLIIKNEAQHLNACLSSVAWADEIIILDSGSTDASLEIAAQFTDKIYVDTHWQGFGVQRQKAQAYAQGAWVLMLDADERITPELAQEIQQIIQQPAQKIYQLKRLSWCFGRFIRHSGWYPDQVARLYPRQSAGYNAALVHEKLENPQQLPVATLNGDLLHFTYQDIRHYLEKSAHYAQAWAQQRHQQGKSASLSQGILHGLACFMRMYLVKAGFLDGRQGLLLALLSAHSTFVKYASLWALQQPKLPNNG